ncbi:MAG: hypothetical protein AAFU56_07990, partial [Pseudomonadota bacterium]
MILFVGFAEDELNLLNKAAERLDVLHRCAFIAEIGTIDDAGHLVNTEAISRKFPSVIFLNLDSKTESWQKSLTDLKDHPRLRGLPVVGLGRVPEDQIVQLYEMRLNSYIRKPNTFEAMVKTADIALKFWLDVSMVPGRYI